MNSVKNISEKIFHNAIDAIEIGIEDFIMYEDKKDIRRLNSSTRNIFAGILLLFKSKLAEFSPNDEALLKARVVPIRDDNGTIHWIGKGRNTVDYKQICDRFESLKIHIDCKRLESLHDFRNNIEHYYNKDNVNTKTIKEYIAKSFLVIKSFIEEQFKRDPKDCFNEITWMVFITEKDFFNDEIEKKREEFNKVQWFSSAVKRLFLEHYCPSCCSELIRFNVNSKLPPKADGGRFECRSCSQKWSYMELAHEIANTLSEYDCLAQDGAGQDAVSYCPNCYQETYCADGDICLLCGEKGPHFCSTCGEAVSIDDLLLWEEEGKCSSCFQLWNKINDD